MLQNQHLKRKITVPWTIICWHKNVDIYFKNMVIMTKIY